MLALTVWQPWASLISAGAKPYEWRGWPSPKRVWGQRIAIHAGGRPAKRAEIGALIIELQAGAALSSLVVDLALPLLERWHTALGALPLSSVLCTAVIGPPVTAQTYAAQTGMNPLDSDRIDQTKWGWPLTDVRVVEPFVPAKGAQGFWIWKEGE